MKNNKIILLSAILYATIAQASDICAMDKIEIKPCDQPIANRISESYILVPEQLCIPLNSLTGSANLYLKECYNVPKNSNRIKTLQGDIDLKRKAVCEKAVFIPCNDNEKNAIHAILDIHLPVYDKFLQAITQSIKDALNNPFYKCNLIARTESPTSQALLQKLFNIQDQKNLSREVHICLDIHREYHRLFNPNLSITETSPAGQTIKDEPIMLSELSSILKRIFISTDPVLILLLPLIKNRNGFCDLVIDFGK